ncbi:hypothetical protein NM208_g1563 [Fusarium decemcellulare]|uniref:Uncharacterized protein n=1 Tax=Fusarium decemcellulare TaxID=57161 RepID=A0ACC1SVG8_9HYPO|nr:hypothetical protein NM208_g1563 [Fusarium decemcellulare]
MAGLILIHDAECGFVIDLAISITGYGIRALDDEQHEGRVPFIIPVERERHGASCASLNRLRHSGVALLTINLASFDKFTSSRSSDGLEHDHEYLFSPKRFSCRDFCRFLALITGQNDSLVRIKSKHRSAYIGLTYPNIRVALSNMPIVSVGADALEFRVDLLKDEAQVGDIPTLQYVAEQLMALRLQSELPVIFTIRLKPSGGRWPLEEKELAIEYLRHGLLWGVEFIDVEDLLGKELRESLISRKGNTKVIASHHDFSGKLDWSTSDAYKIYDNCASYGDVVLMAGISSDLSNASKVGEFRDKVNSLKDSKPLAAFDTGRSGKLSRILNPFLQATTHHLLPTSSAPDQLSLVEANGVLSVLGELTPKSVYVFQGQDSDASLMDKCFNELNLPHRATYIGQTSDTMIESLLQEPNTAGGVFDQLSGMPNVTRQSPEALATGLVDTVVTTNGEITGHNCQALGLRAILLQEHAPSAFENQQVLVVGHSYHDARTIISVLLSLSCSEVLTLGFAVPLELSDKAKPFNMKTLSDSFNPAGIFCMLPIHDRCVFASLVTMISKRQRKRRIVYLDTQASTKDPAVAAARSAGWCVITREHISAAVLVERLRVLVDQSVPYSFVRMVRRQQLS